MLTEAEGRTGIGGMIGTGVVTGTEEMIEEMIEETIEEIEIPFTQTKCFIPNSKNDLQSRKWPHSLS